MHCLVKSSTTRPDHDSVLFVPLCKVHARVQHRRTHVHPLSRVSTITLILVLVISTHLPLLVACAEHQRDGLVEHLFDPVALRGDRVVG